MPNPLTRAQLNTSTSNVDRPTGPQPETPIEYDVIAEGYSLPYRGDVDHGIGHLRDQEFNPELEPDTPEDDVRTYDNDTSSPDPIPVRLVSFAKREIKQFRTGHVSINALGSAVPIVGQHEQRTSIQIKNLTPAKIGKWITLIPRGTYTGLATVSGDIMDFSKYDGLRLAMNVYSISGTTPSIRSAVIGVYADDSNVASGSTTHSIGARTTVGSITSASAAINFGRGRGLLILNDGSADQSIDVELMAWVTGTETSNVWIGNDQLSANPYSGWSLGPGESITLADTAQIWGYSAPGNPLTELSFMEEYTVAVP